MNICCSQGVTVEGFRNEVKKKGTNDYNTEEHIFSKIRLIANEELDLWPGALLEGFFGKLETIALLPSDEKAAAYDKLTKKLTKFFDALPLTTFSREDLTKKLSDLLSLPVWKHRYELYAAWILTTIDLALANDDTELHHDNGTLALLFRPTHIMSITTAKVSWNFGPK